MFQRLALSLSSYKKVPSVGPSGKARWIHQQTVDYIQTKYHNITNIPLCGTIESNFVWIWRLVTAVRTVTLLLVAAVFGGRGSNFFRYRKDAHEYALFTVWADRYKQILKKWRALPSERKAPFLQQARENRAALRMRRAQQVSQSVFVG